MAQYKVPQDVEADDKLLGPFTFRQFVYLLIAGGLIAIAVLLFRVFPLLAIIPVPPVLLLLALALPLKKDQPMETYLAALVSYYLKPHTRIWEPGQRESTITITAPKIIEQPRTRDITSEEATHRLSFLADIVDTGGYAVKGANNNSMREELIAEANATADIFENNRFDNLSRTISRDESARHDAIVKEMRTAIEKANDITASAPTVERHFNSPAVVQPGLPPAPQKTIPKEPSFNPSSKPSILELSQNPDFSVATIAKEANRINRKENGEVFISLH